MDGVKQVNSTRNVARRLVALIALCTSAAIFAQESPTTDSAIPADPAAAAPADAGATKAAAPKIDDATRLSHEMTSLLAANLERYLDKREFLVAVKVTMTDALPVSPIGPYDIESTGARFEALQASGFAAVGVVDVEISLTKRLELASKPGAERIVKSTLRGLPEGKLKVTFGSLEIDTSSPDSELRFQVLKSESALQSVQAELRQIDRERATLSTELAAMKAELAAKASQAPQATAAAPEPLKDPDEESSTTKVPDKLRQAVLAGAIALCVIILGVFAIMASKIFARSIESLGGGLSNVAQALESSGGKGGAVALSDETSGKDKDKEKGAKAEPEAGAKSDVNGTSFTGTMEELRHRLVELAREIGPMLTPQTESWLLKHLAGELTKGGLARLEVAVATLEVMGKEKANHIFSKLSREHQEVVVDFLKHGSYSKPKVVALAEAGEALLTRLLADNFRVGKTVYDPGIVEALLKTTLSDLVQAAIALEDDAVLRLFCHLEPQRLAAVLAGLKKDDPKRFAEVTQTLHRVSDFDSVTMYDATILGVLAERIQVAGSDDLAPYLRYYKDLIESADEDLAQHLLERLAAGSERIKTYLERHIVVFNTYFLLPKASQALALDGMSNLSIAVVLASVDEAQRAAFTQHFDERRMTRVKEEMENLTAKSKADLKAQFDKVRASIVQKVKIIVQAGGLDAVEDPAASDAPPAAA